MNQTINQTMNKTMNRTKIHEPWAKPWTINQGLTLYTIRSSCCLWLDLKLWFWAKVSLILLPNLLGYADYNSRPIFELVLSNRTWCCKITIILWFGADLISVSISHGYGPVTFLVPVTEYAIMGDWKLFLKVYLIKKLFIKFSFLILEKETLERKS